MNTKRVKTCNVKEGSSAYSAGSRAHVLQPAGDRFRVSVRSRSGRWIITWIAASNLENFRVKTLTDSHPHFNQIPMCMEETD